MEFLLMLMVPFAVILLFLLIPIYLSTAEKLKSKDAGEKYAQFKESNIFFLWFTARISEPLLKVWGKLDVFGLHKFSIYFCIGMACLVMVFAGYMPEETRTELVFKSLLKVFAFFFFFSSLKSIRKGVVNDLSPYNYREIHRDESPIYFWLTIGIQILISIFIFSI